MTAFLQAKHYRRADRKAIDWLVLHSMENDEARDSAEAVAAYFAKTIDHPASAHVCVDNDSYVECVHPNDIAYHCGPTGNARGYGIEQAGRAMQSRAEWLDAYDESMFDIVAQILAQRSIQYGIPLAFVNAAGLRAGQRGVTTHYEVTKAFHESTHTDPGPGYPIDVVLGKARSLLGEAAPAAPATGTSQLSKESPNMMANDPISGGFWTLDETGALFADEGAPYCEAPNNHPSWNAANPNANHDWGLNSANGHFTGIAFWKGDGTDQHGNGYVIGFRFNGSAQPSLYHFDRARTGKS